MFIQQRHFVEIFLLAVPINFYYFHFLIIRTVYVSENFW